jgi:hypothetical protein
MAASVTVQIEIPSADSRGAEVQWAAHALAIAAHAIRRAGGAQTSGTITGEGGIPLGRWDYLPQAAS